MGADPSSALVGRSGFLVSFLFALSGAAVGTIFWVIARPDRQPETCGF
jgi:hypothetical protein